MTFPEDWTPADVNAAIQNPFYTITLSPDLFGDHPQIIDEETWIQVNARMITDDGADVWLRNLLSVLQGNFPRGDGAMPDPDGYKVPEPQFGTHRDADELEARAREAGGIPIFVGDIADEDAPVEGCVFFVVRAGENGAIGQIIRADGKPMLMFMAKADHMEKVMADAAPDEVPSDERE